MMRRKFLVRASSRLFSRPEPPLAVGQRDRLGVFPHVDQVGAEIRLHVELVVIQPDQRLAQTNRQQRADRA